MKRFILLIGYMVVLAFLALKSDYPSIIESLFHTIGDVILHAMAYFWLTIFFYWSVNKDGLRRPLLALALAFAYSLILEGAQLWVPGRLFSLSDIFVNLAACGLGAVALIVFEKS